MNTVENEIKALPEGTSKTPCHYIDLSRGARIYGLRAPVQLESRVLEDYREFDPLVGYNVAGVVLSTLSYDVLMGGMINQSRMTVCLARRDSNQTVEVDLAIHRRVRSGQEGYFLRFADEHDLAWDKD
jgi:hypothetical protein